jgi:hypothetical protein
MPRAKRKIQSEFSIDGFSLVWHLHREQQLETADGWKGLAILVSGTNGTHRELLLEYPTVRTKKTGYMRTVQAPPTILAAKVEAHVRQAMAAGWDPGSRGQPFVFHVQELPH